HAYISHGADGMLPASPSGGLAFHSWVAESKIYWCFIGSIKVRALYVPQFRDPPPSPPPFSSQTLPSARPKNYNSRRNIRPLVEKELSVNRSIGNGGDFWGRKNNDSEPPPAISVPFYRH